jgi:uncharacterized membrane protein YkvA (DUF1232 family)
MNLRARMQRWAGALRRDSHAIFLAARDPRVPWYAKAIAVCVGAYAVSPIDLIPDFIPVFGYLDDLIIVPAGILIVIKLIPPHVMAECRVAAEQSMNRPVSRMAAVFVVSTWVAAAALFACWAYAY